MTTVIADTSALVSLGIVSEEPAPLSLLNTKYTVLIPTEVDHELSEIASYEDTHGQAATTVLALLTAGQRQSTELDHEFPLDDGENAAVSLANDHAAAFLLCDEFNSLGLIHASLADTRLITTPTLLSVFVERDLLPAETAISHLESIATARSWNGNSYVERVRSRLNSE